MSFTFKPHFPLAQICSLAEQYDASYDAQIENEIAPAVRSQGYFTRGQFLAVSAWKTPRSKPLCEKNDAVLVREVTSIALSAKREAIRIGIPQLLHGVSLPTASVLLHFGHKNRYPILDVRALESLSVDAATVSYTFEFWWAYVRACRDLADKAHVDMRTLDRALWQYSANEG